MENIYLKKGMLRRLLLRTGHFDPISDYMEMISRITNALEGYVAQEYIILDVEKHSPQFYREFILATSYSDYDCDVVYKEYKLLFELVSAYLDEDIQEKLLFPHLHE